MTKDEFISKIVTSADTFQLKPAVIRSLFQYLTDNHQVTMSDLLAQLAIPKTHLGRILAYFHDFFQPKSAFIILKAEIKEFLNNFFALEETIDEDYFAQKISQIFTEVGRDDRFSKRQLDQFLALPQTIIKRGLYFGRKGELWQRTVLLLGDNDLTSVAIALLNQAKKIMVIDLDDQVLVKLKFIANKYSLPIQTFKADLRNNLTQINTKFDFIFTDPPYTLKGMSVFLDQTLGLIKPSFSSSIYFCYGNSSRTPEKISAVQNLVLAKKLVFAAIEENFNQYRRAKSIGNTSSLYHCVLTPINQVDKKINSSRFYTHEK